MIFALIDLKSENDNSVQNCSLYTKHNSPNVHQNKIPSYFTTSYPRSSLFLPRESTLVSAGHVAPKIWVLTRMYYMGGVAKCKIVTSVRMVESTGGHRR